MNQVKIVITKVDEVDQFNGFQVGDLLNAIADSCDTAAYFIVENATGKHLLTACQVRTLNERK